MTMRNELWEQLEASLSALVDSLAAELDHKNLGLLRDFIANREYGVALEWLQSSIKNSQVSHEQQAEIRRLAKIMGIKGQTH